ncbi:MAG: hypothetical protein KDA42_00760 [Planctomycetales bacterium]|nr:hypothetical protein [Planctomycetales bacterium]
MHLYPEEVAPNSRLHHMRRSALFIVVLGVVAGIALLPRIINSWVVQSRSGPLHVYHIDDPPDFLTDDLAISTAQKAMEQDGFSGPLWSPIEDDRTASPNGSRDTYLVRNAINPNHGYILFWNEQEKRSRIVQIEFDDGRMTCQLWISK